MAGRPIYNPDSFQNVEKDGKVIGFSCEWKHQYYRGICLSIVRDLQVSIDGKEIPRENIRLTVNNDMFSLEEMRTVVAPEYRWEFGDYATLTVLIDGGLEAGKHKMEAKQVIAPSYMPFLWEVPCNIEFEI